MEYNALQSETVTDVIVVEGRGMLIILNYFNTFKNLSQVPSSCAVVVPVDLKAVLVLSTVSWQGSNKKSAYFIK